MTLNSDVMATKWTTRLLVAVMGVALVACASRGGRAPIEDRPVTGVPGAVAKPVSPSPSKPAVKVESASRPSHYTVKPGDTLSLIAREWGVAWQELARWNGLENPNQIEVGQSLRLTAPAPGMVVQEGGPVNPPTAQPASSSGSRPVASVVTGGAEAPASNKAAPAATPNPPATAASAATAPAAAVDDGIGLIWPANGAVISNFDAQKNKGISIAGNAGDPVLAAADGVVVYAGAGLRGYGNLVIVKHNAVFLTAYAHNQTLLVKDDQQVRKGQKIAEMGSSESDRVKLHFELRRNSTPVDPAKYLPPR
jgi:lipoprotein NlpD